MKTGVIVLCRFNSKRLPGKILKKIRGKTILEHIILKLHRASLVDQIVVATSTDPSEDRIEAETRILDIPCFRGNLEDVADRFLTCAETFGFDYAIRINGDNLFTDPAILDEMIGLLEKESFDFITNVPGRSFPYGMSVEILKTSFYRSVISNFDKPAYHEHVTLYLYDHEQEGKRHYFYNSICPELKGINLAIDHIGDFRLAEKIFDRLSPAVEHIGLQDLCGIKSYILHECLER